MLQEKELLKYIKEKHFNNPALDKCSVEDASVVPLCLELFSHRFAVDDEVIIIPVNKVFWPDAKNLMCSLARIGMRNIIFWSLDNIIHNELINANQLSIFLPGFPLSKSIVKTSEAQYTLMLRYKPKVIQMLLNVGLNVWYLDAENQFYQH
jgi:Nucleotide-diphospho-sugar transferase